MTSLADIPNILETLTRLLSHESILDRTRFNQRDILDDLCRGRVKPFLILLHRILLDWSPIFTKSPRESQNESSNEKSLILSSDMTDLIFVSTALRILNNSFPKLIHSDTSEQIIRVTPSQVLTEGKFTAVRIKLLTQFIKLSKLKCEDLLRKSSRHVRKIDPKILNSGNSTNTDSLKDHLYGMAVGYPHDFQQHLCPSNTWRNHLIPYPHPDPNQNIACSEGTRLDDNGCSSR